MAKHSDHQDEQEQERPFLASTEAHQATLMKEVKKGRASDVDQDDPAPMLPPIMSHSASEPVQSRAEAEAKDDSTARGEQAAPNHFQQDLASQANGPDKAEDTPIQSTSFYPSSQRAVAGAIATLVALAGFSAVWFNANQDVYTLSQDNENASKSPKQVNSPSQQTQATKPSTLGAESKTNPTLTIQLKNLPALAQGTYHLWIKQDETINSLGAFNVNDQGQAITPNNQTFKPKLSTSQPVATLLVSIETSTDPSQPSSSIILSGDYQKGKANLKFTAIDLDKASGIYTIAAPTDLSGDSQSSGFWLAKTDGQNLTGPGLSVPNAPVGWKYEAQLVYKDQIIAAGRFSNPNDRDDFGVFTPNPDQTPNYPGEDYLQGAPSRLGIDFPANLTSGEWKIIISLEPDQNGTDPTGDDTFFLQPFSASISQGAENYKEYPLALDLTKFPTAAITAN